MSAVQSGEIDTQTASSKLSLLVATLGYFHDANGRLPAFDPFALARAGTLLLSLDAGNFVGMGALEAALRNATDNEDASAMLELAELAAPFAGPSRHAGIRNTLRSAAGRAGNMPGKEAAELELRLLTLSMLAQERSHPEDFRSNSSWRMAMLGFVRRHLLDGDAEAARAALARLADAPLVSFERTMYEESMNELAAYDAAHPKSVTQGDERLDDGGLTDEQSAALALEQDRGEVQSSEQPAPVSQRTEASIVPSAGRGSWLGTGPLLALALLAAGALTIATLWIRRASPTAR